jgi:hypothetical protein
MTNFSMSSLMTRIFYGGIIEEILLRWNVLVVFVALGCMVFRKNTEFVWWAAIALSALFFGCGHIPFYVATAIDPTMSSILLIIAMNSYAGIFFGWVFKKWGLIFAMIAHSLFHLVWFFMHVVMGNFL